SSHVTGKPSYVNSIHDPSIMYKEGTFWILGGYTQNQNNLGWRFTPMLGKPAPMIEQVSSLVQSETKKYSVAFLLFPM
ncbi:hypothetical protein KHP57_19060, partial [Algiphilus sp. NNCM1]|nr:hypothetical protein [Algiphilus acroporae]